MANTFIVAEAGVNHNGNEGSAWSLLSAAYESGANAVKWQLWSANRFLHLEHLRLRFDFIEDLFSECRKIGLECFATPFDAKSARFLDSIGMEIWKVPSNQEVINDPETMITIKYATSRRMIIISTGTFLGVTGVGDYARFLARNKPYDITLLHCVSVYPLHEQNANLGRIIELCQFGYPVGFSDHSTSIDLPVEAVRDYGATVIEKHLTIDRKQEGPDHCASLEPHEFRQMVENIREVEKAL